MFDGALNPMHIVIVLAIVLVVFGPKRIPELAKSLGNGVRELKDSFDGSHDDDPARPAIHAATATPDPADAREPAPTPEPAATPAATETPQAPAPPPPSAV